MGGDGKDKVIEVSDGKESKKTASDKEELGLKSKKAASDSKAKPDGKAANKKEPAATAASKPAAAAATASAPSKPAAAPKAAAAARTPDVVLADAALTQIAQAKWEAQEEKLRDVARQSVALIRDYHKLDAVDCTRKIADIQKSLLKYEMQFIRAWDFQEQTRKAEIEGLEAQTVKYRQEAEEEGGKIVELREVLEKERQRRKRYEGYEEAAAEVNKKKTRTESQAEIQTVTSEIAKLQQQQKELEAMTEERNERAQLLRQAVEELKKDLLREHQLRKEVLGDGVAATAAATEKARAAAEVVEVIS